MLTREQILDKIIETVAADFGLTVADVTKKYTREGQRANAQVAEAKRVICYLFPILSDLNYRVLMKKLQYEEKTRGSLTKNRKLVQKQMFTDYQYRKRVTDLRDYAKANIEQNIWASVNKALGKTDLPVTLTVQLRWGRLAKSN